MTAGLPARRASAAAALADFDRYFNGDAMNAGGIYDWTSAALRLAAEMRSLLTVPQRIGSHVRLDGTAIIAAPDVGVLLGALHDAQEFTTADSAVRYASLARALGDDR